MLPEIGATELLVIAVVALVVVGPKDLPILLRKLGQWMAKARGMANEFRASFDEMARQSELDELRREVQALRTGQFSDPLRGAADDASNASVDQVFADIDAGLKSGDANVSPALAWQPQTYEPDPIVEAPAGKPKRKRAPAKPKAAAAAPIVEEATPARKPRAPRKKKTETAS
ncbi:MAG: twin-arginine translocase subunit TatB [Caulobacter sp.]|nr:twin-arginine translocase subunit TatB [Caulobacter sp.]